MNPSPEAKRIYAAQVAAGHLSFGWPDKAKAIAIIDRELARNMLDKKQAIASLGSEISQMLASGRRKKGRK